MSIPASQCGKETDSRVANLWCNGRLRHCEAEPIRCTAIDLQRAVRVVDLAEEIAGAIGIDVICRTS
jgi:hypothetical protein